MVEKSLAVEVKDLLFYYLSPTKRRIFPKIPISQIYLQKHVALKSISVNFAAGKITGLLGKNGSGKTSLIKIITGARFPQAGSVKVFGESPNKVKHRFGLCLGASLVYHRLSARENLEYFARLYNISKPNQRIEELAELLDLQDNLDQMVETFSFGMKAKLAIARSMIHSPELLILDEPTLGIDFHIASEIRKFIKNLKCTVLLTTHYMEEAEMLCDDVVVIDSGSILAQGTKTEVLRKARAASIGEAFANVVENGRVAREVASPGWRTGPKRSKEKTV